MSETGDIAKLEFVLSMIKDIEEITDRHENVSSALSDVEGKHALQMCLLQIGEELHRIGDEDVKRELPVTSAYRMRNFIAHDYGGINLTLIKATISRDIPDLKDKIEEILRDKGLSIND